MIPRMKRNELPMLVMMMSRNNLPVNTCKNIIGRKAERVSWDAGLALSTFLEYKASEIGEIALDLMRTEGKKTLKAKHILMAYDIFRKYDSLLLE